MTTPHRPSGSPARLTIAGLLALAAAMGACSTSQSPSVRVVDARVVEESPEGLAMVFVLEGTNENTEEIPLQRVVYSLSIDGQRVFRGERMAEATLRRLGAQTFVLPVSARWEDLPPEARGERGPGAALPYRLSGNLQYIAPGALAEVFFDSGVRRPTLRFSIDGEMTFSAPSTASPPEPASPTPAVEVKAPVDSAR